MAAKNAASEKISLKNKANARQVLFKIYRRLEAFGTEKGIIENPDQAEDIKQLLQYCNEENTFEVNSISNELLVKLCQNNIISRSFLINKLLTFAATTRNLVCIISSIWDILTIEILEQLDRTKAYSCPYKLRSPPHPLITLLQQRPDSWDIVISQIKQGFISALDKSQRHLGHILGAIKPLLSFIYLDPCRSSKSWEISSLHTTMLQIIRELLDAKQVDVVLGIAEFMIKILQLRKTDGPSISDNAMLTEQLIHCLINVSEDDKFADIFCKLGHQMLADCHKLLEANQNITMNVRLLLKMFLKKSKDMLSDDFIFLVALLLYRSPSVYVEDVLRLAMHILPCYVSSCHHPSRAAVVLKSFMLPLITIISSTAGDESQERCQKMAKNLLINVQNHTKNHHQAFEMLPGLPRSSKEFVATELILARYYCQLLYCICKSEESTKDILRAIKDTKHPCDSLILLLSTLIVNPNDFDTTKEVLNAIGFLAKENVKMAMDFLPLLLHTANNCNDATVKFQILESLPELACHKPMVAPILKTITMLGSSMALLPLSIRLTTDLWKKQPRVFPYLLQLLSKDVKQSQATAKIWEEITISKAASIFEICKLRPAQHGTDVIGLLSKIFDDFEQQSLGERSEVAESAVYLALEALKSLCEFEVADFQTGWAVVAPKVQSRKSDIVLKGIISLLSVAPTVLGHSTADTNLKRDACNFLWKQVNHENGNVGSAALACLKHFPAEDFIVAQLPEKVRSWTIDLLLRKHNMKRRSADDFYDPSKEIISGPSYAMLLEGLKDEATQGFSVLISKLLTKEVQEMPRNISSANTAKRLGSAYDKFIDGIPDFFKLMYEKSNRPAVIPSLAAGLLCCYKSSVQLGKNEKTGRRHLIEDAKAYRQILDNLLNEVLIEHMDWQQAIAAPTAWERMMSQVFDVVVEGRKAELSLLFNQGRLDSEADLKDEIASCELWARDQLSSQLMRASKGNPTVQGNSVIALAGLAAKISQLPVKDERQSSSAQYSSRKDWLLRVADTVMVVLDGNFKPKGEPMQWCQQFSSQKSTASSLLSRASAAVAISEIAPILISMDLERIQQMTQLLISRIPGQEKAGTSAIIQFNSALGLGMLVSRLQQERFSDVIGQDGYLLLSKAVHVLENTVYNEDLNNREGAVFGYGLALGATFTDSAKDSRVHASVAYKTLMQTVQDINAGETASLLQEGYCFALAISTVSGFSSDVLEAEVVLKTINILESLAKELQRSFAVHAAFGTLLHGVLSCGLIQVKERLEIEVDNWLKLVTDESKVIEERIASVHGLLTAFGSSRFLFQFDELDVFDAALKNKLAVVIKTVEQVIQTTDDTAFCTHSCKLLGLLYMVHHAGSSRQVALPSNYNYLHESTILRSLFNCLVEAGKSGPNGSFSSSAVSSILEILIISSEVNLPPVNWALALSPLMKLGFDAETRRLCLQFAILIASSNPTLPTWLISWMNPSVFLSLETECKCEILRSLDTISRFVPIHKLKMVIEKLTVEAFQKEDGKVRKVSINGLKKIANMKNPVQSSLTCVKNSLETMFLDQNIVKDEEILKDITECLLCLPQELRREVLNSLKDTELIISVESMMVGIGGASLKTMDRTFELFSADPKDISDRSLTSIKNALQRHHLNSTSSKEHEEEMMWFLEQMGRIKSFVVNKMDENSQYWLDVLAAAVNTWSASGLSLPLMNQSENTKYCKASWDIFGEQLKALLQLPRWNHLQENVLEWLIAVLENYKPIAEDDSICLQLRDAMLSLRHTEKWKSQSIWMKSLDLIRT